MNMGSVDSVSSVCHVVTALNGLVLGKDSKDTSGPSNDGEIFIEDMESHFPDPSLPGKEVIVVKASRTKKKRPPREDFGSFDKMYSLTKDYLGSGSFSHVFVCVKKQSGEKFAAKLINKDHSISRDRILNEVDLHHLCRTQENILHLVKFYEENSRYIFVYPIMNGGSLLKHIEEQKLFTEEKARDVVVDLTTALSFLHKHGVAHRDLKPDNILCDNNETIVPVKICDFDLASGIGSRSKPVSTPVLQTPVGSAEYMAPEVVEAFVNDSEASCYDKRCDLWSLGVILYIMLSGHPPFYGNCDEECGWDRNEACTECQNLLLQSIQDGRYSFSIDEWSGVSDEAKDLISHLLVRDASQRYSAEGVLKCRWVAQPKKKTTKTPKLMSPLVNFDMAAFWEEASSANRTLAHAANLRGKSEKTNLLGLSPPGTSSLAKRRAYKSNMK